MNAAVTQVTHKSVARKGEVRIHLMPAITMLVLLYTFVMTLTWLRDQTDVSLITRPYTAAVVSDDAEVTSTMLTTIRGWLTTAADSAQMVIESQPVQTVKDIVLSTLEDMRDLVSDETTVTLQDSLWIRYLPLEDSGY